MEAWSEAGARGIRPLVEGQPADLPRQGSERKGAGLHRQGSERIGTRLTYTQVGPPDSTEAVR
jgi:hypothetical protein